jgi:epoxyqueuosine reductase
VQQTTAITNFIKRAARDAGFELAGIAPVCDFHELKYFPEWIAAGRAGEMKYLEARDEAGELKRASLRSTAPWARSVIVCAINYNTAHPYSTQVHSADRGWISRYAWSREDYHDAVLSRLRTVEAKLQESIRGRAEEPEGDSRVAQRFSAAFPDPSPSAASVAEIPAAQDQFITRCYVDTGPLVERVYAKYAGLGWIAKNTCLINQQLGSWLFLGVILSSLELTPDLPAPDRCGTCTRCIDACPTDALIAPYQLDSNLCISYLTIEKRGEIPEQMREGLGRHVFGCDICQDVCPWNRKAPATIAAEFQPRAGLVNPALAWLAEISTEEFRETFRGSPIRRTKRVGLRRNAILAMGNSGNQEFVPFLQNLTLDEDAVIAESARWALGKLEAAHCGAASDATTQLRDSI